MSREELESFLRNMHAEAYNQGVHAMASAVSTKVETALRNTPGIGEKRFNDIITSINAELNKEDS
jgi:Holliday junction resolvasome RuvABC DNA-binding subunit